MGWGNSCSPGQDRRLETLGESDVSKSTIWQSPNYYHHGAFYDLRKLLAQLGRWPFLHINGLKIALA